jgi:hypothetical protein
VPGMVVSTVVMEYTVSDWPAWVKSAPRLSFQIWLSGHWAGLLPLMMIVGGALSDEVAVPLLLALPPCAGWPLGAPFVSPIAGASAAAEVCDAVPAPSRVTLRDLTHGRGGGWKALHAIAVLRNRVWSGNEPLPDEVDVPSKIVDLIGKISGYPNPANGCVDVLKFGALGG